MGEAFVGAEAIDVGRLTRGQLRWNYTAVHPGVYVANGIERTLFLNTCLLYTSPSPRDS